MLMYPGVSVIIPTYNRADFVLESLSTVFNQTYPNIEIIVVDDGSTDDTFSRLKAYSKVEYPKLQSSLRSFNYVYTGKNKGVSAARNYGIRIARYNYIAFLDSDDLWYKDKLSYSMEMLLTKPYYKACYTNERWLRNGSHLNQKARHKKYSGFIYEYCLPLCIISPSSIVLKKEVINKIGFFDEDLPACEDYDYWLRLTSIYPVYYIEDKLIIKRGGHSDQLSCKYPVMDAFRIKALIKILSSSSLSSFYRKKTHDILKKKLSVVKRGCIKRGKSSEASYYAYVEKSLL